MNSSSVSAAVPPRAAAAPAVPSAASREVVLIALLVVGVVLAGSAMQLFVEPGPVALVASAAIAGAAVFALGYLIPGRLRQTLAGFRFVSTLLFALAVAAILGTLVLQGKSSEMYRARYGAIGDVIVALRLDDIFHSVWFGGLLALFLAAVLNSAILRWPVKARNAGFFTCHAGLLLSLAGAALSTTMSVKGRVDLHAGGEHANAVAVTRGGSFTGQALPLGFDLRLDRFDVVRYDAEYRIAYYEQARRVVDGRAQESWTLKASFDPELAKHRLPGGDSFKVKAFYPDLVVRPRPAAAGQPGTPALQVFVAGQEQWVFAGTRIDAADGLVTVAFDRALPSVPDAKAAVLVSLSDHKVVVRGMDGEATHDLADGLALAGNLIRIGKVMEDATRLPEYATASKELRNPAVLLEVAEDGRGREALLVAREGGGFRLGRGGAIAFEHREDEVKAFRSDVTVSDGSVVKKAVITVNNPLSFGSWTFYQANYDPRDPTYSGLEAVKDPGVPWVFLGFALISIGVFYMFYVESRLKRQKA